MRDRLRSEVQLIEAAELLPHQRRGALLVLEPTRDLIDAAFAIAADDRDGVNRLLEGGTLRKPSLAEMSDWCVAGARFQFVILQPFVLAQQLLDPAAA